MKVKLPCISKNGKGSFCYVLYTTCYLVDGTVCGCILRFDHAIKQKRHRKKAHTHTGTIHHTSVAGYTDYQ